MKKKTKFTREMLDKLVSKFEVWVPFCEKCGGVLFIRVPGKCRHWKPCPKCNKVMK